MSSTTSNFLLSASLFIGAIESCNGFVAPQMQNGKATIMRAESSVDVPEGMNPNNPNLPEVKGDFDWDAKFAGDEDWITENVPGKIVLNEIDLAKQVTSLNQLEEKWRKEREIEESEGYQLVGFTEEAQLLNGRFAMFFLVTGLLTEYWTGVSLPGQVEEMLRVGGFLGME